MLYKSILFEMNKEEKNLDLSTSINTKQYKIDPFSPNVAKIEFHIESKLYVRS